MFNLEFVDPIDMYDEDDEEIIQLIQAMIEENQTKSVNKKPLKTLKEPPIIFNLCGEKYEIEK